ncbi:retropepsin-like aspartic protease family protein [Umezakia ovalisporum]|uniref:retropepsin-like aspartic protease family protein n=1 Tax=Umezakia ovalisporum TaxID=75695 RepID=UPI0035B828F2
MLRSFLSPATLIFISSTLAVLGVACHQKSQISETNSRQTSRETDNLAVLSPVVPIAAQALPATKASPPSKPKISFFEMGLDQAVGAWSISQSAESPDDWNLVASQYQDAIRLMGKVPQDSPQFAGAQRKIFEYRTLVKAARQQAIHPPLPSVEANNQGILVAVPPNQTQPSVPVLIPPTPTPQSPVKPVPPISAFLAPEKKVFIAAIKRRIGGTPIVEVTFNNRQKFEMILDTGASSTVITPEMADVLGVVPVGTTKANTASARTVEFPIGYVDSMAVAGVTVNRVAVAIAGPELETGLLGHDFFGNYDVTIRRDVVEFSPQSHSQVNSVETGLAVPIFPKPNHSE